MKLEVATCGGAYVSSQGLESRSRRISELIAWLHSEFQDSQGSIEIPSQKSKKGNGIEGAKRKVGRRETVTRQ